MKFTGKRKCALAFLIITFLGLLVLRLVFDIIIDAIIDMELEQKLPLKNGTMAFKNWVKPPIPVDFNIYVFDLQNPEEVLAGTARPSVVEKGPYVYKMHLKKTDIKYHENNTVEYRQPEKFIYDREASVGPETDTFTTVNIPFFTVANILQYEPLWLQAAADSFFRSVNESTFMKRSVYDIWWGYSDPVLEEVAALLSVFNLSIPILNGKFGFYMDRNNTDDGLYNVHSGVDKDFSQYAMIDRWNHMRQQSIWRTNYTNRIKGSGDGAMQPPRLTKNSKLTVFDSNLYRTLNLEFNQTSTFKGVDVLRFLMPYSEFADAKDNPMNAGYCTPDASNCPPSGGLNMSVVKFDAPLVASLPHFIGGDPFYQRQVKGLKPSQEKHQPFYDYHALTGVALSASRRFQLSVKTKALEGFEAYRKMSDAYIPVIWIDGLAIMDDDTISMFKRQIQDTLDAMVYVKAALIGMVCLVALVAFILVLYWRYKDQKVVEPLDSSERRPLMDDENIQNVTVPNDNHRYDVIH